MPAQAKLGKKCNACGTWNRPNAVGAAFDPKQLCFMPKCKCILYQGLPKDIYPGKHHRPGPPSASAGAIQRSTREPVGPAVGAKAPKLHTEWGGQKELDQLREKVKLLEAKGADKDSEAESGDGGNDHTKAVKDCRAALSKCKIRVAEAEKEEEAVRLALLAIWQPRKAKAEEELQKALDSQQAAKPVDQRQRELEREVRRLENSCKQQETTNEEHAKQKEEAIAAEAAGIEKANSLKEQLAQAKGKLEAARLEQAPVEASTTSARRVIVPRAEETQDEFAQRRLELAQLSLPPSKQPNDVAQREMLEEYRKIYADMQAQGKLALAATPAPKQAPAGQKRDREPDTADGEGDADMADPTADDLDDDLLDCFHAMQNSGGGDDVAEDPQAAAARRLEQRKQFQAAATKGGLTKVFHLKGKRVVAAQA